MGCLNVACSSYTERVPSYYRLMQANFKNFEALAVKTQL